MSLELFNWRRIASLKGLGCAFQFLFWFLLGLLFRNSGYSSEFPDSGGTHVGIKSFQGKINLLRNSGGKDL
jgi:hypothetical protein